MVRKFKVNNNIKGKIEWQLQPYVKNEDITFEKDRDNVYLVIIKEGKIPKIELDYMYKGLLNQSREVLES